MSDVINEYSLFDLEPNNTSILLISYFVSLSSGTSTPSSEHNLRRPSPQPPPLRKAHDDPVDGQSYLIRRTSQTG